MRPYEAKGLLAFWADFNDEHIAEIQNWHNCEHMIERVSIPGFIVGRRYRGIDAAPTFLFTYETTDTAVLKSAPYLHALNNSTPWTQKALSYYKNNMRNIYSRVSSGGKCAPTEAPYVYVVRFNLSAEIENDTVAWIKNIYLPEIARLPQAYRCQFYQIDEKISSIMTGERMIYGGGPGQQKYLLLFELAGQPLPEECQQIHARHPRMLGHLSDQCEEYSYLDFVLYAPEMD